MGVAHFTLTAVAGVGAANTTRFVVAVGRKPGVRDVNLVRGSSFYARF